MAPKTGYKASLPSAEEMRLSAWRKTSTATVPERELLKQASPVMHVMCS